MWHSFPLTRIAVIVVLALLVPISLQVPGLAVSAFSVGAIGLLVVLDRLHQPTQAMLDQLVDGGPAAELLAGRAATLRDAQPGREPRRA